MTEYDYSPEAYERFMATQTRISNWADNVSQSLQSGSQSSHDHPPSDHHRHRSRLPPSQQPSHSQHSRSNSTSRPASREQHYYNREPTRQRSHSHSSSRPHGSRSYSYSQPVHSRTYSYALNQPLPPLPIQVPHPIPFPHPVPRRSRTLPPPHNVVYHTYDPQPRGAASYVMIPQVYGSAPQQMRMQSVVTPTKRAQPLLKRLFTSFGPWGSSSSGPSPKSNHPPQRRHRRRRSF